MSLVKRIWSAMFTRNSVPVRDDDLKFVDDMDSAILQSAPNMERRVLYVMAAFIVAGLVWAYFAQLDEVTIGAGKVIPSQQLQVVQNLEGGILQKVYVREGELVEQGQPLLRIDDTRFRSDLRESEQERAGLAGLSARYRAELASVQIHPDTAAEDWERAVRVEAAELPLDEAFKARHPEVVEGEKAALSERLSNLKTQLSVLERQVEQKQQELVELRSKADYLQSNYELGKQELELTEPLAKDGVISKVELIKLRRQVNDLKGELSSVELMIPKVEFAIQEAVFKRNDLALTFRADTQKSLNEVDAKLAQLHEAQTTLKDRVERTVVSSPVKGTVKKINVNTVGGVIQPGMDLIEIVPIEDNLLIEARILPKDIAFLRPKLDAVVKFSAYDFAIYGGLKGKLEHISADTIQDEEGNSYYLIRVRTEKNYLGSDGEPLPIIPGMMASVDVITGKKSVLDYLLKPILRAKQQSLRER